MPKVDPKEQQKQAEQQVLGKQQQPKGEQQQKGQQQPKAKAQPAPKAAEKPDDIYRCDFRVGKIVHVEKHPSADALYKETIDFVCSSLLCCEANFLLRERRILVL
ncbi:hypothetical protein M1146_06710 [Patescibacteria group bacterium]|nr:hypothetical protein [Patescibacteria group bacterium]